MKLTNHYIRLRDAFPHIRENEAFDVTLDELAAVLSCTHRNAQLLLKKMAEQAWLVWLARRGRGNRSTLTFAAAADDMIVAAAMELVERKDLRGALEQLNGPGLEGAAKERFHRWLSGYFGYSSEVQGSRRFDTLRFPLTQPLQSLDPATIHFTAEAHLVHHLFDPLVRYNRQLRTIEPHVAHAWETNAERTRWTFHLRKGVQFHHGRELTAEDVRFTFERLKRMSDGTLYGWASRQIERVDIADPVTVHVTLNQPNALFLQYASTNRTSLVPAELCQDERTPFAQAPVGTGPFRLKRHDGSLCVLDAFPAYFQGRAHLDRVELWHIPNLQAQDRERTLESFQIIHNYQLPDKPADPWQQVQQQGVTCRFLTFNLRKQGPLQQPGIREAVCLALHAGKLLDRLAGDATYAASSFIRHDAPRGETLPATAPFDAEAIRDKLKQSGYAGERLSICTITQYEKDALLAQTLLQEAGIAAEVKLLSAQTFKGEARLHADLLLFSIMLDHDAELRLIDLYESMQRHLEPSLKAHIAGLLQQTLCEPSPILRDALLLDIERELVNRRLLCFLYAKRLKTIYHASVKGISLEALDWVQFKNIWFKP